MKALVISGGGSYGAFTVGKLQKANKNYDIAVGTSTGALIASLALLNKYDKLVEAYTSITADDIFTNNPFDKNGKIRVFNALWKLSTGHATIGDTQALRNTIKKYFTIEDYNEIINSKKELYVTVTNLSKFSNQTEFISIRDFNYEEFVNYMWASANVPGVTSLYQNENGQYVDGGVLENVPIRKAAELGANEIDVFVHNVIGEEDLKPNIENFFHLVARTFKVMRQTIEMDDVMYALLMSPEAKITTSGLPYDFKINALVFNKEKMKEWYELGYRS